MRRRAAADSADEADPLLSLVNLFDASMLLVVALLLALAGRTGLAEIAARLSQQDITIVTNPGKKDMEMIIKKGKKIERLRSADAEGAGYGKKLGTAYQLESGEVIYVPDAEDGR